MTDFMSSSYGLHGSHGDDETVWMGKITRTTRALIQAKKGEYVNNGVMLHESSDIFVTSDVTIQVSLHGLLCTIELTKNPGSESFFAPDVKTPFYLEAPVISVNGFGVKATRTPLAGLKNKRIVLKEGLEVKCNDGGGKMSILEDVDATLIGFECKDKKEEPTGVIIRSNSWTIPNTFVSYLKGLGLLFPVDVFFTGVSRR
jgi:hypothetical protein